VASCGRVYDTFVERITEKHAPSHSAEPTSSCCRFRTRRARNTVRLRRASPEWITQEQDKLCRDLRGSAGELPVKNFPFWRRRLRIIQQRVDAADLWLLWTRASRESPRAGGPFGQRGPKLVVPRLEHVVVMADDGIINGAEIQRVHAAGCAAEEAFRSGHITLANALRGAKQENSAGNISPIT